MTLRRLLLALGIGLAVLIALGMVPRFILPRPGVTAANCARIRPGMRQADVAAILGGPPRPAAVFRAGYGPLVWLGEEGVVAVDFDRDGLVVGAQFNDWNRPPLLQRLRRRLGL